ncbi:TPA: hypothetical protein DCZ31_03520 [Patescibacteria group bacterium]|nr:hypothetical protein [Candidatus Gracilibacteria bacterium]
MSVAHVLVSCSQTRIFLGFFEFIFHSFSHIFLHTASFFHFLCHSIYPTFLPNISCKAATPVPLPSIQIVRS